MFCTKSKPQSFKVIYEARDVSVRYTGCSCSEKLTCMRSHCSHTFLVMLFADNPLTILKLPKEYGCSSLALSTAYHWFCTAAVKNRQNKHDRNHGRKEKEDLLEQNQTKVLFKKQLKIPSEDWILVHHIIYRSLKETICHCQTTLSSQW